MRDRGKQATLLRTPSRIIVIHTWQEKKFLVGIINPSPFMSEFTKAHFGHHWIYPGSPVILLGLHPSHRWASWRHWKLCFHWHLLLCSTGPVKDSESPLKSRGLCSSCLRAGLSALDKKERQLRLGNSNPRCSSLTLAHRLPQKPVLFLITFKFSLECVEHHHVILR